jgi:hypothetical protein
VKRLTVVLGPPTKVAPTNDIVKDKADEHPGHIVEGRHRRQVFRATEDKREVDVLEETNFELPVQNPLEQWCEYADKEEEEEDIVGLTVRE